MLFMVHYEVTPENRDESYNRVDALGGDGAPPGIEIVGTWSSVTQLEGWVVAKTDDIVLIGKWMRRWTNLNVNTVVPIVDGETQREIMSGPL
jgi:hypothetical protein